MFRWLFGQSKVDAMIMSRLEAIHKQNQELLSMRDRQRIVNMTVQLQRSTNRLLQAIGEQTNDPTRRTGSPGTA